jgi:hypothetical protein
VSPGRHRAYHFGGAVGEPGSLDFWKKPSQHLWAEVDPKQQTAGLHGIRNLGQACIVSLIMWFSFSVCLHLLVFVFETGSCYVTQVALNIQSYCLSLLSAGIIINVGLIWLLKKG